MKFWKLASAATALILSSSVNASLIINGSFEGGSPSPPDGSFITLDSPNTSIEGWTVTGGSVDWIHSNYWNASNGLYSLDMSGLSAGTIESTSFATVIGQEYLLTFDIAGNFAEKFWGTDPTAITMEMNVDVGNTVSTLFTSNWFDTYSYQNMGWIEQRLIFTATDTLTSITFTSLEDKGYGAALDNVSVTGVVPVPAAIWLFGSGLLGLVGFARRKKA